MHCFECAAAVFSSGWAYAAPVGINGDLCLYLECSVSYSLWIVIDTLILHFHMSVWNKSHSTNKPTSFLHGCLLLFLSLWDVICNETTQVWQRRSVTFCWLKGWQAETSWYAVVVWGLSSQAAVCEVKVTFPYRKYCVLSIECNLCWWVRLWLLICENITLSKCLQTALKSCDKYWYQQRSQFEHLWAQRLCLLLHCLDGVTVNRAPWNLSMKMMEIHKHSRKYSPSWEKGVVLICKRPSL